MTYVIDARYHGQLKVVPATREAVSHRGEMFKRVPRTLAEPLAKLRRVLSHRVSALVEPGRRAKLKKTIARASNINVKTTCPR